MHHDRDYYYQRAETELRLAQQATEPAVVKAHYHLAGYYLDLAYGDHDGELAFACEDTQTTSRIDAIELDRLAQELRLAGVIIFDPPNS